MATINMMVEPLTRHLSFCIPTLEQMRKDRKAECKERAIATLRGTRHWWFGRLKTDEEIWHSIVSSFLGGYSYFYYMDDEIRHIKKLLIACNKAETLLICLTVEDCVILDKVGKGIVKQ